MFNVNATYKYTLAGLNGRDIQKTYLGSHYAYSLERSADKNNSYLFRGRIMANNIIQYDLQSDYMVLRNFGHDQTLAYDPDHGIDYFLTATHANHHSAYRWATQLGRFQYKTGQIIDDKSIDCLGDLNFANNRNINFGLVNRVEAALTNDRNHLLIVTINTFGDSQYTLLDNHALNQLWDRSIRFISAQDYHSKLNTHSFEVQNALGDVPRHTPHHSIQGVAISNDNQIYIIGGRNSNQRSEHPGILKVPFKNSSVFEKAPFYEVHNSQWAQILNEVEPENIQLKGQFVYIGTFIHNNQQVNRIYIIPKSEFTKTKHSSN